MDVREEDVFQPAADDVVQDWMLNWVIRGVTLDQSYKKEDYIPIKPDRFEGLQQFTYSAGAHPEAYPIDVYVYKLNGLEYATDLRKIDLSYNMVSDLSPLKDLTNLRDLTFYMNKLTDISPLQNLTNLERLNVAFNEIKSLKPLAKMSNLQLLNVSDNGLSDITGIEGCKNLSSAILSSNEITDISAMENLTNMEEFLWLNNNNISDISALLGMTKLQNLDLFGNNISDISALKNMRNLKELNLGGNSGISDITPLVNLTNLNKDKVNLNGTKIETKKDLLFAVLEVNKMIDRFHANEVSIVDKGKVEEAKKAYNKLSEEAKSYVFELRIKAAEENIKRLEQGLDIIYYDELEEFANMAKQDVKTLEIRVTDKDGQPVRHARYNVKGQSYGNIYGTISTDRYGLAEFTIPSGSIEAAYTFELQESEKFTGMTDDIKISVSEDSAITHINGKVTDDGKIDITLTLKDGEQLSVNKANLERIIKEAEAIHAEDYTADSYKKLETAIASAKTVLNDTSATQDIVDNAETDVRAAIDALEKGADLRTLVMTVKDENGEVVSGLRFNISNSWNGGSTEIISDDAGKMQYTVPNYPINYYTLSINGDENYTMIDGDFRFEEENNKIVKVNGKEVTGPEDLSVTILLKKKEDAKPVDKTALNALVEEAKSIEAEDYTEDSYAALQAEIAKAETILVDDKVSQATVNSQKTALQDAINGLIFKEVKPIDKNTIIVVVKDSSGKPVKGVKFGGFSSWGSDKEHETDSRGAIIYKTNPWETIEIGLRDERYTTDDEPVVVGNGGEGITTVNGKEVTSLEDLVVNITVKKVGGEITVDKSALEAKIAEALQLNADDYTEDSYAKLTEALAEAQKVFDRVDASQDEVNAQLEKLANAIAALVEKPSEPENPVDKTPLEEKLKEAKAIKANGYTPDSYAALQNAIKEAETVLNGEPSQDDIFATVIRLQKAIDSLKEEIVNVNKTLLKEKLEEAKEYTSDKWTEESFAALQAAIVEAEAVFNDPNASQVDVDRKIAVLNKAIAGLEEEGSETPNPEDPEKPDTGKPGEGSGNGSGTGKPDSENPNKPDDGSGNAGDNNKPAGGKVAPKTGDTAQPFVYVVGMLAAVGACVVVFRRKRVK